MWLANQTHSDIANAVRAVARHTNSPSEIHWKKAVSNLEYVFFTSYFGITFQRGSGLELVAYADADYASKTTDKRSVSDDKLIKGRFPMGQSCAQGHACAGFRGLKSA